MVDKKPISVNVGSELYNRFCKWCEAVGLKKSTAMEQAIKMYLDEVETNGLRIKNENTRTIHRL